MKPEGPPTIVSLESHRRRKVAEVRDKAVKARKTRAFAASGERAINWRRAPLAIAAFLAFMAVSWIVGRLLG
jgi:hypothetical protein